MDYQANRLAFENEYRKQLEKAVLDDPKEYPWHPSLAISVVADRMLASLKNGTCSKDGKAFKETCKALKIKWTWKCIYEFIGLKESL